ncbi:hypothetical protein BDZ90DRAFT_229648 [Jaminaea rosea]|uniref:Uncharacterized protein n=1 Tax=Jaminaea rosea TaxID=1569628 RepID=A0A316V5E5_9BASI|nr:hypothetical protein BDZ90DRAFT_229648 [Jaminaea rosea]PWN30635.1 hypothetical protein BDZ90DRAFT_229648 [Jaminaea rosea]
MGLRDLKRMLDSGRRVAAGAEGSRGIPMWLVVSMSSWMRGSSRSSLPLDLRQIRAVKASWHQDGSWPILGIDEEAAEDALASLPRSVHAASKLLRPPGHTRAQIPPRDPEAERGLPPQRPDPDPEDVVRRYEEQGVDVGPAPKGEGFEHW